MLSGSSLPSNESLCAGREKALHVAVRYGKRYAFTFNALGCVLKSREGISAAASDVTVALLVRFTPISIRTST